MSAAKERRERKGERKPTEKQNRFWPDNWKFFVSAFISIAISLTTVFITLYYELWRTEHSVICSFAGSYFDENYVEVRLVFENQGTESEVILGVTFYVPDVTSVKSKRTAISKLLWDDRLAPMLDEPFSLTPGEVVIKKFKWFISADTLQNSGYFSQEKDSELGVDLEIAFLNSENQRSARIFSGLTLSTLISTTNEFYYLPPLGIEGPPSMTNKFHSCCHPIGSIELFENSGPITFGLTRRAKEDEGKGEGIP